MRVDPSKGQDWKAYAKSVILFSLAGWLLLYFILRTQTLWNWTGLNPQHFHSGTWNVTFNTTSSFVTNTNWQYYGGETTMSYFSQMAGLTVQNFVSAGGRDRRRGGADPRDRLALGQEPRQLLAGPRAHGPVRAACRSRSSSRSCSSSRARSRTSRTTCMAHTLTGGSQSIAQGPVASQEAIKELGHQRRRLLQRQLRAPVREPVRVHEPGRDAAGADHPGGDRVHVRPDVGQAPPGLRDLRDDDDHVPRRGGRRVHRRGARLAGAARGRPPHGRDPRLGRRQHGGQGAALRDRRLGAVRRRHDRHLVRRGEQRDRVVHRDRRCGPDGQPVGQRGRSSAASAPACTRS